MNIEKAKLLDTKIEDLELSIRAYNCLKAAKIKNLLQVVQYTRDELLELKKFGHKSLSEIEKIVYERGFKFGMRFEM